jgi:hypothetical protein
MWSSTPDSPSYPLLSSSLKKYFGGKHWQLIVHIIRETSHQVLAQVRGCGLEKRGDE